MLCESSVLSFILLRSATKRKDMKLRNQIESYLSISNGLKPNTINTYERLFKAISDEPIMDIQIDKLKPSQLKRWVGEKSRQGYSYSTINVYISGIIRPALQMAYEDDDIPRNPAIFKLTTLTKRSSKESRALTKEEQDILIEFLNSDRPLAKSNRGYILLILNSGLRISEVCGLTMNDIDYKQKELSINKQLMFANGFYSVIETKSDSGRRTLPITPEVKDILEYCVESRLDSDMSVDGYSGFIFIDRQGRPANRHQLASRYKYVCREIDKIYGTHISETSVHTLRHTYCTNLINRGVSLKTVQYLLGHKDATTTLNIYTHVSQKRVFSELNLLD